MIPRAARHISQKSFRKPFEDQHFLSELSKLLARGPRRSEGSDKLLRYAVLVGNASFDRPPARKGLGQPGRASLLTRDRNLSSFSSAPAYLQIPAVRQESRLELVYAASMPSLAVQLASGV